MDSQTRNRALRRAAPELLNASKAALHLLIGTGPVDADERKRVVSALREAVYEAEGIDPNVGTITFTVTPVTANTMIALVESVAKGASSASAARLHEQLVSGRRDTKQRTYLRVGADHNLLDVLKTILLESRPRSTERAFRRIAQQIEKEVLSRHPLEMLAEASL